MSDPPGDDPQLPDELRRLLESMGGADLLAQLQHAMSTLRSSGGPVNWDIARQIAVQAAADGDRPPTPEERARFEESQGIAEHWLDEGGLPAPRDAGHLAAVSRQEWANDALEGLRPVVEPVATAAVAALSGLVDEQGAGELAAMGIDVSSVGGLGALIAPMGAVLMGIQSGQVIGTLAGQLLGQYDLGIPTADASVAYRVAVNAADAFDGYGLDATEVSIVLSLHEGAHRRQYHAVGWLNGHLAELIGQFAAGTRLDPTQLADLSERIVGDVDPDDPESLRQAVERASQFRLEPTPQQRRTLERVQGVVVLLQAWARHEVAAAARDRLPNLPRIEEVLRRRRATAGEGERMLSNLLGLDLRPADETLGDRFVEVVIDARGGDGLQRALGHPENLPDAEELAEPARWLERMESSASVPDDASTLFDEPAPPSPEDGEE